jgi:RNase P/RNase MRP subunit p29
MNRRVTLGWLLVAVALLLSACSHSGASDSSPASDEGSPPPATVTAARGKIVPTLSAQAEIEQLLPFVVSLGQRGSFKPSVHAGEQVKKNQVIGWTNGRKLFAPEASKISRIAEESKDLPKNFPVFELSYLGFSLKVDAGRLLRTTGGSEITGKFQIQDGVGPASCASVVSAAASGDETASEDASQNTPKGVQKPVALVKRTGVPEPGESDDAHTQSSQDSEVLDDDTLKKDESGQSKDEVDPPRVSGSMLSCLIGKDQNVRPGQKGTVVLSATQRENTVVLPLSAVAGRTDKGRVVKVDGSKTREIEVKLGATDGANIEILSGLKDGDTVAAVSPDIDPRGH